MPVIENIVSYYGEALGCIDTDTDTYTCTDTYTDTDTDTYTPLSFYLRV
jgi:hypothetical protein